MTPKETTLSGEFVLNDEPEKEAPQEAKFSPATSNNLAETPAADKKIKKITTELKSGPVNLFTALALYPDGVKFENEEEDEDIVLFARAHFITNVPWILTAVLLALIPVFFMPFIQFLFPALDVTPLTKTLYTLFYYLIIFGFVLVKFSLWYYQVAFVSNQRVVDVEIQGVLYRSVAKTKLDLIEDISYKQVGSLSTIFNYGDVFIETAAEAPNFHFEKVPQPNRIVDILIDLIGKDDHS